MLNFTVGPVQSSDSVLAIGAMQVPYFRTKEFSEVMLENEKLFKKFAKASDDARVVFITGSGTASMEASVINTLTPKDKVLIVNGGTFSLRFVQLCALHGIPYETIDLKVGQSLHSEMLQKYDNKNFTAFLVNVHETSTGVHYDMKTISDYCKRNGCFLIVDAISSFLADEFDMSALGVDVMITGSQKALACPPGISIIALSQRALTRVENSETKCMYLDLKNALTNGLRGQTPFTPAVGILLQINKRLKEIDENGGVESEIERISNIAKDFRSKIKGLPFQITSESLSNAVTPLRPLTANATDIFNILKEEYNIWICPNGGELKDVLFRVGHIGELTTKDNDILIEAFYDMKKRGLI